MRRSDTSAEAQRVLTEAYRAMPPAKKWRLQAQNERALKALHEASVCRRNPQATRAEVQDSWNAMVLGESLWRALRGHVQMDRDIENIDVVREVTAALERLGILYALGGSWASSFYGESRSTRDADLAVEPFPGKEDQLAASFGPDYYVNGDAIRQAIRDESTFNIINTSAGFKVDCFIRKDQPFDRSLLSRRVPLSLPDAPERPLFLVSPEDIILLKLNWYRLGAEVSDSQWTDILGVLRTQAGRLDEAYLDQWAAALAVSDLLARAREAAAPSS